MPVVNDQIIEQVDVEQGSGPVAVIRLASGHATGLLGMVFAGIGSTPARPRTGAVLNHTAVRCKLITSSSMGNQSVPPWRAIPGDEGAALATSSEGDNIDPDRDERTGAGSDHGRG